jgi:hypothetical protein
MSVYSVLTLADGFRERSIFSFSRREFRYHVPPGTTYSNSVKLNKGGHCMAKLILKRTTKTTVTEEIELIPAVPGEEQEHRYLKVCGYEDHLDFEFKSGFETEVQM